MSNPFEKPTGSKKEENASQKSDIVKEILEYKTGKKLPENKEELFRNFDELIPKEIDHITFHKKARPEDKYASPYIYSREGMKSTLERELYGTTMKDVENYFKDEFEKIENGLSKEQQSIDLGYKKTFDNKLGEKHDKAVELFNQLNSGNLEIPLADIELKIDDIHTDESEKNNFRKFAERMSAEIYKNKPKSEVATDDIRKTLKESENYFSSGVKDKYNKEYNKEHFGKIFENFDKGNFNFALKEIESNISWIQEILENRKNKDMKDVSENLLKERYGENFRQVINKELEKLRSYRKFLRFGESKKEEKEPKEDKKTT